jgi:hypothetical protein
LEPPTSTIRLKRLARLLAFSRSEVLLPFPIGDPEADDQLNL